MTRPRAVILNDTATRYHHGCARVMANLTAGLERAGVAVARRIPARADWTRDRAHLAAIADADLIVINGEGTLHDGAAHGARLLSVLDHPARGTRPVALVNALWSANPPEWNRWLTQLALAAARDSASAGAMAAGGAAARWLPDLSLAVPFEGGAAARCGLIVGDSVRRDARRHLARAAQRLGATYLPTKTLASPIWRLPPARAALWRVYNGTRGPVPPFEMSPDAPAYLARLAGAAGHVTGRFHGICLSMLTETPFLALASTTSKVQRLLSDAGLGDGRLVTADDLATVTGVPPFAPAELAAIRAFRARAAAESRALFADLRALA